MKYMVVICVVLALCVCAGMLITILIGKRLTLTKAKKVLCATLLSVAFMLLSAGVYLQMYSRATPEALTCMSDDDAVHVTKTNKGYLFDGPGTDDALVFYPGARVDEVAYAPMLRSLATQGVDVFLVQMPFHLPILDSDAAANLMESHTYQNWFVGGHSLGGYAVSSFASTHDVEGLVLLGSYPQMGVECKLLSIYGSEDGCLDREEYAKAQPTWPKGAVEVVIDGGNHAQYGNYGAQDGDGVATISSAEQQAQTVRAIVDFVHAEEASLR